MATENELKHAKRLRNLDVREVSVVDKPAILREFLVIKRRQTEDNMGAFATQDPSVIGLTIEKAKAPGGAEDTMKGLTEDQAKAVAAWMGKMAKSDDAPEGVKAAAKLLDDAAKKVTKTGAVPPQFQPGYKPGEDKDAKKAADEKEMEDAKKAQQEKDLEEAKKKKAAENGEEYPGPGGQVAKAAEPILQLNADGSVLVAGNVVQKAKSFTQNRTEQLQSAASALLGLMKEVDEDAMKGLVNQFAKGELPSGGKVDSQVRPAPVKKGDGDPRDVEIAELRKRLDTIEKTRQPSQSVDGEGGTDQKVQKGFWGGVV